MPPVSGRQQSLRRQERGRSGRSEDSRSLLWQARTQAARLGAAIAQQTCVTEGLHETSLCHKTSPSASHKCSEKATGAHLSFWMPVKRTDRSYLDFPEDRSTPPKLQRSGI